MVALTEKQARFVRLSKACAKPIIQVKSMEQVKDKRLFKFTPRKNK